MTQSIEITGHDLLRYYYGLQVDGGSPVLGLRCPVDELNQISGRFYDRNTWLEILTPYYDHLTAGTDVNL